MNRKFRSKIIIFSVASITKLFRVGVLVRVKSQGLAELLA